MAEETVENESVDSSSVDVLKPDEDEIRQADLCNLKIYLNSMAYKFPEKNKQTVPDATRLAQPKQRFYIEADTFRKTLEPPGRATRVHKLADQMLSTEAFSNIIRGQQKFDDCKNKNKKKRGKVFLEILDKLEQQCRESAMRDLVEKFANYLAQRCVQKNLPSVMTESFQRMTRGLVCNMYMSLGINGKNLANKADHSIYETIAFVLADLIFESHFQLQIYPDIDKKFKFADHDHESADHMLNCLKKRALHATRKISHRKKMDSDFKNFMVLMNKKR